MTPDQRETRSEAGQDSRNGERAQPAPRDDRPLGGLAALVGVYGAGVAGAAWFAKQRGLPERVKPWDLLLIGVASHKLSRRLSKDSVTSPFREPFADFKGSAGPGELNEEPQGSGFQRAVGELITCPFCIGQWVATGFGFGLVLAPRATRLAATIFATAAISDFLQFAYVAAEHATED